MLMNVLRKSLHEVVIPEINLVRVENTQIKTTLEIANKRLDDLNAQLADQGRRIGETNQRIDAIHADVIARIEAMQGDVITRIDATNRRIDAMQSDLITRIDTTNDRLNRLYEVTGRREEHDGLAQRLTRLWSRRSRI